MKNIGLIGVCLFIFIMARGEEGIKFEHGLTWEQIKMKAKRDKKYIFIDCFTTWCGPCKKMDKDVYTNYQVGQAVNERYVAVKLQMDSTINDSKEIKQWYTVVQEFKLKYKIPGYPSFLFFNSDGQLVYQELGYKNINDFIVLISEASNPSLADSNIIELYKRGDHNPEILLRVARLEKKKGNRKIADSIAREYKTQYLDSLDDINLFTKSNIKYVILEFPFLAYEDGAKGRFFKYILHHPQVVDSLYGKGGGEIYIKAIITNDELSEKLFYNNKPLNNNPNWDSLKDVIFSKYNIPNVNKLVEDYKAKFYLRSGNWKKWVEICEKEINRNKLTADGHHLGRFTDDIHLNEKAWTVFLSCNDRKVLQKALEWVDLAIDIRGENQRIEEYYDTKANLLYKLGKTKKAIKMEKKALRLDTFFAKRRGKEKGYFFDDFNNTLKLMQQRIPTWKNMK